MKKNILILLIIFTFPLIFEKKSLLAKCFVHNCFKSEKDLNKISSTEYKKKENFVQILKADKIKLHKLFENIFISDQNVYKLNNEKLFYEIESDVQYSQKDVFFAEGNVLILLSNGTFKADKISYDRVKKLFKVYSNFTFTSGEQYLKAEYLEYDFFNEKGLIENAYGVLNLKNIASDLNFKSNFNDDEDCPTKKTNINNLPSEIELLDESNMSLRSNFSLQSSFKFDFASINKWRFKSEKIILNQKSWNSELIYFTNDPFNKPQLLLKSQKFSGEINNGKINLSSNKSSIILDDKVTLPLGKQTIKDNEVKSRWGIGYSETDKDGLYIFRNYGSINLSQNFEVAIVPYFLIQRTLEGESEQFREKKSSLDSDNVLIKDLNFLDYFGINTIISGEIGNWDLEVNSFLNSINPERLYDSFSSEFNLARNILNISDQNKNSSNESCLNSNLGNSYENYTLDFGLYGFYDKGDIYKGYGGKFYNKYSFLKEKNKSKIYDLILDLGDFDGISNDGNNVVSLSRYGFTASFSESFKISNFNSNSKDLNQTNRYSSEIINKGIFLESKLSNGFYQYSDGTSQAVYSFEIGPSLVFGEFRKKLLDFTQISIIPEFVLKNGISPFAFDDFNNDSRIKLKLKQQLYGPFIAGIDADYNINTSSSSYGKFENKKISLGISRRAYSIDLSYSEEGKSVFLGVQIFDFGYKNNSPSF